MTEPPKIIEDRCTAWEIAMLKKDWTYYAYRVETVEYGQKQYTPILSPWPSPRKVHAYVPYRPSWRYTYGLRTAHGKGRWN